MSHVPNDPTKGPKPKPGDFPDKTKQPGHEKEFEKHGDKRPADQMKPGQGQKQKDQKQPNDQSRKN